MILFLGHPQPDYFDNIFYAFKKTFGDEVVFFPRKNSLFSGQDGYTSLYYNFTQPEIDEKDILEMNKSGKINAVFVIANGSPIYEWLNVLLTRMLNTGGKKWPLVILDAADDDRIKYRELASFECKYDYYFKREHHLSVRGQTEQMHDPTQLLAIKTGKYEEMFSPLPFCVVPEKFPQRAAGIANKTHEVFFRCGNAFYSQNRAYYMYDFKYPNSTIDLMLYPKTELHMQDRNEYFNHIIHSKINLNLIGGGHDCYRFWEIFAVGGFVLSQKLDLTIEPGFEEGVHYDTFNSKAEMYDKIKFYCKFDDLREKIALQGYNFVRNNHTCYHRMRFILDKMKNFNGAWQL
jgi:hypothetical protein